MMFINLCRKYSNFRSEFYRYLTKLGLRKFNRRDNWPPFAIFVQDFIGNEIIYRGWYENRLIDFLEKQIFPTINPDSIALDIGANIGNHSNRFANSFAQVHAFEPNERTYYLLKANAMLTPKRIIAHNVGCSDKSFCQEVNYSRFNVGGASLEKDFSSINEAHKTEGGGGQTANFKLVKLDEYLPSEFHKKVGFMKLDIEGHEIRALKGAENIILESKPVIVFEAHEPEKSPHEYLQHLGYEHFYGFVKFKQWHSRSKWQLVKIVDFNQCGILGDMIIASLMEHDDIVGNFLYRQ